MNGSGVQVAQEDYGMESTAWSGRDLVVGDDAKIARIRRPTMSASTASKTLQCPAAMVAARLIPRTEDPFGAPEMGTSAHSIAEELYGLPPEQRTIETAERLILAAATEKWALDKLERKTRDAIAANNANRIQWIATITEWIHGLFALEDPTQINVHRNEWPLEGQRIAHGPGALEGVPLIGYIDRTDIDEQGRLLLRDYKFGAKMKMPSPRFGDDYGDQLRIYSAGVKVETGEMPAEAKLIYPRPGKQRIVDLSEGAMLTTMASFRGAWTIMHRSSDAKRFATRAGFLCGWCPLANSCPSAKITTDNARAAAATQPSAVQLGIPTIPRGARMVPAPAPVVAAAEEGSEGGVSEEAPRMWVVEEPAPRQPRNQGQQQPGEQQAVANGDTQMTESNIQIRAEGAVYEETVNGSLNYNSFAAIGTTGITMEAFDALVKADLPVNAENLARLSDVFAGIVLRAQLAVTGQASFQRGANTRLRGMLRSWIEHRPAPFGSDATTWSEWVARTERFLIVALTQVSDLYERNPIDNDAHLHFAVEAQPVGTSPVPA